MDGCQPPWCPYVDEWWREATTADLRVRISSSASHWDDDEIANSSAGVAIWRRRNGGERLLFRIGAYSTGSRTGRPVVEELSLSTLTAPHRAGLALVVDLLAPAAGG